MIFYIFIYLFKIGGHVGNNQVGTAEVFDCRTKVWRMISNMSSSKLKLGVGILNNLLYVVSLRVVGNVLVSLYFPYTIFV